jgi:hypothetical protein
MLKGVENCLIALNRKRQKAATASDKKRQIAASSLPPFIAFCRFDFSGFFWPLQP